MHPSFPSVTFPNHWTLVTGLRPDRNGIVANVMEDAGKPGVTFTMANSDPFWWREAEPLWVTAEKSGVRTATMFWPGSNVDFGGVRPRDWWTYAKDNSEAQRVDAVIDWLRRPAATRPQFVTLYFDTVDTIGHKFGPDSEKTNDAIGAVDRQIGRLVDGVAALGVRANYIIAADHGMAATSPDRVVKLWEVASPKDFRPVTGGTVAGIEPTKGRDGRLAKALLKPHPHMNCARKGDLPPALHYGQNARVPSFICIAEIGWYILAAPPAADKPFEGGGAHGYDPVNREMDALFVANGPAFRACIALPAFDNVDVYPLAASLIGVAPRPSDGSAMVFAAALTNPR
jgi:predicted AlkP superfamily pyrophosphatase or phosphodiesterase